MKGYRRKNHRERRSEWEKMTLEEEMVLEEESYVVAEATSSSTTGTLVEPIEAVVKESCGCESQEQEVQSSDPSKKDSDACDKVGNDVDVP
ncbi:hypothetical protein L6452_34437 [Arctium lappa]|uniref:Uncharacterized protein n=1 Tax=Arctium lappa TaxID=4217 RepID=A0ACB8YJF1_ARCLA|nr:hypothetical protein L6452_34437 [Arctium lappa]